MYDYETHLELTRDRGEQLRREAGAKQLAHEARGRWYRHRQRFALDAGFGQFGGARRQARLRTDR